MQLPASLDTRRAPVTLRRARVDDLPALVALLADDQLGRDRDGAADIGPYREAFHAIDGDPAHLLLVAEQDARLVGTFQLSFLPGLSRRGSWRAQIEAVRVAAGLRSQGLGAAMMRWAVGVARERGCSLVQLTSDTQREDAHRFYRRLGFVPSHTGFKLRLDE